MERTSKVKDMSGQSFGALTILKRDENIGSGRKTRVTWLCKCICGNVVTVRKDMLMSGHTKSCGCLKTEYSIKANTTHGMSKSRFHNTWANIKNRCLNEKHDHYYLYGGRGIKVCEEWLQFENFKNDMYDSYLEHIRDFTEKDTSIDRKNPDGNYEPNNCRWATLKNQANNKRNNISVTIEGNSYSLIQICTKYNLKYDTVLYRFNKGFSIENIIKEGR